LLNLVHVVSKWGMVPQCPVFMGGLSSRTVPAVCTGPPWSKWSTTMRRPKLRRPPEIPLISVKPQQSLSLLIGVLLKSWKSIYNHRCCPISAIILTTSKWEAIPEICRCSLKLVKTSVLGGSGSPLHLSPPVQWAGTADSPKLCAPSKTLSLFCWCLFLLLHLSPFRSMLDGGW
jgi:hypothetical protein